MELVFGSNYRTPPIVEQTENKILKSAPERQTHTIDLTNRTILIAEDDETVINT
jgi:hypothetical protein